MAGRWRYADDAGDSSASGRPPRFSSEPWSPNIKVSAAHAIKLKCKAKGIPKPEVTWYMTRGNETRLLNEETFRVYEGYEFGRWTLEVPTSR